MDHFAGLDVSVKETSVCVVDDTGTLLDQSGDATVWQNNILDKKQEINFTGPCKSVLAVAAAADDPSCIER
jgi:hypothetical protein